MKIRKFLIGWCIMIVAIMFTINANSSDLKLIDRIDNDVGIEMYENSIDNTLVVISFEFENTWKNEAEVEISPGDIFCYVSSTSNDYDRNETLLGSYIEIINLKGNSQAQFDNSNNKWVTDLTSNYETSTKILNYNSHFRLSRSRLV